MPSPPQRFPISIKNLGGSKILCWVVGNHSPFHLTARLPSDFTDAWAVVFFLVGQDNLAVACQKGAMKNGNCRLACASLLNGVEGLRFFQH